MRFPLLCLIFVFCISFGSCNSSTTEPKVKNTTKVVKENLPEGWQVLKKEGYSINHASDWTLDATGRMGTEFILYAPQEEGASADFVANINLLTQDIPTEISLDEFAELSKEQIANYVTDAKILASSDTNLNGQDFKMLLYVGRQGKNTLQFQQYYTLKNEKVYILTLTTQAEHYEKFKKIGEQTMGSIQFD